MRTSLWRKPWWTENEDFSVEEALKRRKFGLLDGGGLGEQKIKFSRPRRPLGGQKMWIFLGRRPWWTENEDFSMEEALEEGKLRTARWRRSWGTANEVFSMEEVLEDSK